MNVDVSPDGKEIVFDLLGNVYTLPISGGNAKCLTEGRHWNMAPRYAPDGKSIVFVSDRSGQEALWKVDRMGRGASLVLDGLGAKLHSPLWSAKGRELGVAIGMFSPSPAVFNVNTKRLDTLRSSWSGEAGYREGQRLATFVYSVSLSPDGEFAYFGEGGGSPILMNSYRSWLVRLDRSTGGRVVLTDTNAGIHEFKPILSRSGRILVYGRRTPDARTTLRVRNLETGRDRELLVLTDADEPFRWADDEDVRPNFAFTPDESAIVLALDGKLTRVPMDGGAPQMIPFRAAVSRELRGAIAPRPHRFGNGQVKIRAIRSAVMSPNGRLLVFAGVGRLWVEDVATKKIGRLTDGIVGEQEPAISPDGHWVAFIAYQDTIVRRGSWRRFVLPGALMLAPLRAEAASMPAHAVVVGSAAGDFMSPAWYGDNRRLLLVSRIAVGEAERQDKRVYVEFDRSIGVPLVLSGDSNERVSPPTPVGDRLYRVEKSAYKQYMDYENVPVEVSVVSTNRDGSDRRVHSRIRGDFSIAVVSPTAGWVFLAPRNGDGAYVARLHFCGDSVHSVGLTESCVRRVGMTAVTHAAWQTPTTVLFGIANNLFRASSEGGASTEALGAVQFALPRGRAKGTFVFKGARIITLQQGQGAGVVESGTIVVHNGRISEVGSSAETKIPADATVFDGDGLTIVPGFIDVHWHGVQYSPRPMLQPDDVNTLAYGVTSRYDAIGYGLDEELEHAERIETGRSVGPRSFAADVGIGPGSYVINSIADARHIARKFSALGVPVLKEYLYPSRQSWQLLARAAGEEHLGITAHRGGLNGTLARVADGFTAIEHAPFITPLHSDVTTFMTQSGVNWTPTLMVMEGITPLGRAVFFYNMLDRTPEDTLKLYRFRSPDYFRQVLWGLRGTKSLALDNLRFGHAARAAAAVSNAGGRVSIGAHGPEGLTFHWEMWALRDGGASVDNVLRAATINGARKIGLQEELGSLEGGKLADMVVLRANPMEDIRNTSAIKYVVIDGIIYDAETMTELWPAYNPLPRMGWQTPEDYQGLRHARPLTHQ